jgi:hypothetical protein
MCAHTHAVAVACISKSHSANVWEIFQIEPVVLGAGVQSVVSLASDGVTHLCVGRAKREEEGAGRLSAGQHIHICTHP